MSQSLSHHPEEQDKQHNAADDHGRDGNGKVRRHWVPFAMLIAAIGLTTSPQRLREDSWRFLSVIRPQHLPLKVIVGGKGGGPVDLPMAILSVWKNSLSGCRNVIGTCRDILGSCPDTFSGCRKALSGCREIFSSCRNVLSTCRSTFGSCRDIFSTCPNTLSGCREGFSWFFCRTCPTVPNLS